MNKILLASLTKSDLMDRPVWRHWTEGDIEFVSPTDKNEIMENADTGYIVLTDFTLCNGSRFSGFCSSQDPSGLDYLQPTMFTDKGHLSFWRVGGWTKKDKNKEMQKLGFDPRDVFPIEFKTLIKCDGVFYSGTLEDFNKKKE